MKLKNKKTGEIVEFRYLQRDHVAPLVLTTYENDKPMMYSYNSLAELNEEWEDYEEPKEYWYIDYDGGILCGESDISSAEKMMISMGNHFQSLEKAERAVEKLKAWKRLKNKGFDFVGCFKDNTINYEFVERPLSYEEAEEVEQDLSYLFGGEE